MIHYVYKIVNKINQKTYIGYTINPERRWKTHLLCSTKENVRYALHHAMKKYGIAQFEMEIIFCSTNGEFTLSEMEPYFIKLYQSRIDQHGYNLTDGGESNFGWKPSKETRKRMSDKAKLRIVSEATKEKHRQNTLKHPPMHNANTRLKVSNTLKKRGIKPPLMTPTQREAWRDKIIGKPKHSIERKKVLSDLFKTSNPMHNPESKEKARIHKIGKGVGAKNGRALFCKIINADGIEIANGHLATICAQYEFPFYKFMKNSRKDSPIERGNFKGWNIIRR